MTLLFICANIQTNTHIHALHVLILMSVRFSIPNGGVFTNHGVAIFIFPYTYVCTHKHIYVLYFPVFIH